MEYASYVFRKTIKNISEQLPAGHLAGSASNKFLEFQKIHATESTAEVRESVLKQLYGVLSEAVTGDVL